MNSSTKSPRDSALVRAARRQSVPHTPVWFMRQAGRSLPEYRKVREGVGMLDSCRRPELVAEITMQPVRRHGVDAAILFSDIVVPLAAVGVDLDIVPGVGPVVAQPFRAHADLDRIPELTPEHVPYITEAVGHGPRGAGRHAADRFRRRTVHSRVVPRRGWAVQEPRAHQGPDAWRPGAVECAVRPAGTDLRRVPPGPGAGRGIGRAAVRLVGGRAVTQGLRDLRPTALAGGLVGRGRP